MAKTHIGTAITSSSVMAQRVPVVIGNVIKCIQPIGDGTKGVSGHE